MNKEKQIIYLRKIVDYSNKYINWIIVINVYWLNIINDKYKIIEGNIFSGNKSHTTQRKMELLIITISIVQWLAASQFRLSNCELQIELRLLRIREKIRSNSTNRNILKYVEYILNIIHKHEFLERWYEKSVIDLET